MNIPNKYCHNCGKPVSVGSKFCGNCGTSLASIDEKPPEYVAAPTVPNRLQTASRPPRQPDVTFTPITRSDDYDDDDNVIRADKVNSLAELGISVSSIASLDVAVQIDRPNIEKVGSLVTQGAAMPQGYQEPARASGTVADPKTVMEQFKQEAGSPAKRL